MAAPDRGSLGSVPAVGDGAGAALRAARRDAGLTVDELVRLVAAARRRGRMDEIQDDSIRRQLFAFESGRRRPGEQWRSLLAEALQTSEDRLFGPSVSNALPRPLLADTQVTDATIRSLLSRRAVLAETEHIFGPQHVLHQVATDMQVIGDLIRVAPSHLLRRMRLAAASYAELLGWLAQDSGNAPDAQRYTSEAFEHLELVDDVDPAMRAMLMMRRSNIITSSDPRTAMDYAEAASQFALTLPSGRLHAAIARQQALAALAAGEERGFHEYMAYALDLAEAERATNDLAAYASTAYVASESAIGLIWLQRADEAAENLAEHLDKWPDGQQRDHAIARLRHLRALVVVRDYTTALQHIDEAIRAWRATPSARAREEIRSIGRLLRDRSRGHIPLPLNELRGRIKDALQGGSADG